MAEQEVQVNANVSRITSKCEWLLEWLCGKTIWNMKFIDWFIIIVQPLAALVLLLKEEQISLYWAWLLQL